MPTEARYTYEGTELDLFAEAHNWKAYWLSQIAPYIHGHVLEVGAGLGSNTAAFLALPAVNAVTCLEPDADLAERLRTAHPTVEARVGTLLDLGEGVAFDAIVYIDVLEHIEDDTAELERAAKHLAPEGHLVVLSPAHPWLFTPFDAAIGHYRRYTQQMLQAITPPMLELSHSFYLDSVGMMLASAANKVVLKQAAPTSRQVALWDRVMVPVSRLIDPLLQRKIGKTVVGVWTPQREGT